MASWDEKQKVVKKTWAFWYFLLHISKDVCESEWNNKDAVLSIVGILSWKYQQTYLKNIAIMQNLEISP